MILLVAACAVEVGEETGCSAEPVVTWESFGEGLLVEHCQGCHASSAVDRHGAPIEVVFDTHEDAILRKEDILRVATSATPSMPPVLSLGDADRERLRVWLSCYE